MSNFNLEAALLQLNKIPEVLVEGIWVDEKSQVIICGIKDPVKAQCPVCKHLSGSVKNRYLRKLIGIGIPRFKFEVRLNTVHFSCRNQRCPKKTFTPPLEIKQGKSPYLASLKDYWFEEHFVIKKNNLETVREVKYRWLVSVSEATLRRIQGQAQLVPIKLKVKILGIDEIYPKGVKKRDAHLAMFDLERGVLLGMAKGIRQGDLIKLWEEVEDRGVDLSGVNLVVRDLYAHWDKVIEDKLEQANSNDLKPKVTIVADPFHTVKRVQVKLYQNYYAPLRKQLKAKGDTKGSLTLFRSRWAYRKGAEKLTPKQSIRLMSILNRNVRLDQAWILKEKIRLIYHQATNRKQARGMLAWAIRYSKLEDFPEITKTLVKNQQAILNCFEFGSNGARRLIKHYPEERISQIRRIERRRGGFRKVANLTRNLIIGYQMTGII